MAQMAHLAEKLHFTDRQTLERLNTAVILGLVGGGLAACVIGACICDVSRLVADW
jgi:hypothetical protein